MAHSSASGEGSVGWPFIRGPSYDGHSAETRLADSWPDQGPPVLWTRELGEGYSAFVAWGDRVATQCQTLGGQYVICLSADAGETLWEYRYEWPYEPACVYPGPRATPTYYQGRWRFRRQCTKPEARSARATLVSCVGGRGSWQWRFSPA
ncbi:MAG: hypothetical protein ACOY3P_08220, partial [Planctomycetota bacterium]